MTKMTPETIAARAAARKEEKRLNALQSIANKVVVSKCQTYLTVEIDFVMIHGKVENFNAAIEKMGYRPVRVTSNMLNAAAGPFAIDINTPSYCDPGCESYHSM